MPPVPRSRSIAVVMHLLLLFLAVSIANADDCGDFPPTHIPGKPFDSNIHARDLTSTENDRLERLFESIEGKWQGEAEEFICHGKGRFEKISDHFNLRAKVSVNSDGYIRLEADLRSSINRKSLTEIMSFYLIENRLRLDTDSSFGDIENLKVSENKFQFSTKRGFSSGYMTAGQARREIFFIFTKASNSFTTEKRVYTNDKLNSIKTMHFTR